MGKMGEKSRIEWTDHTFNPWIGCTRVSAGCVHCYAEAFAARYKKAEWGPLAKRVRTGAAYWKKALAWNKEVWGECQGCGWRAKDLDLVPSCPQCGSGNIRDTRQRVFCASLADVFEDNQQVANWRGELFQLIEQTPNLDWLLLTKRPEKIFSLGTAAVGEIFDLWMERNPQVWLGCTVESQEYWKPRAEALLSVSASVHFLSVEPMIGAVRLTPIPSLPLSPKAGRIDWVICGGESGAGCRPMEVEWARDLLQDCRMGRVKFFMKQLGGYPRKRDRLDDFPEDLRVRETPLSPAATSPQIGERDLGGEDKGAYDV